MFIHGMFNEKIKKKIISNAAPKFYKVLGIEMSALNKERLETIMGLYKNNITK